VFNSIKHAIDLSIIQTVSNIPQTDSKLVGFSLLLECYTALITFILNDFYLFTLFQLTILIYFFNLIINL
jgi:hypothetical protein